MTSPQSAAHCALIPSARGLARRAALAAALVAPLSWGCAAPTEAQPGAADEAGGQGKELAQPLAWNPDQNRDQRKLGEILLGLDMNLRTWNQIVLGGGGVGLDATHVRDIEVAIKYDAQKYQDELMDQLVAGPPNNRRVAAAALGFTESERALAPLLAALTDPDEEVVANALLSLGTLRAADTPLVAIAAHMNDHARASVRANAGRALRALVPLTTDPADRDAARSAARRAVGDEDPGVRMHALMLLATLEDVDSLDRMAFALDDRVPLVARAASRGIAYIGSARQTAYGKAARALVASLGRVDRVSVRPAVLRDLQALGKRNYEDVDDWLEWANRLP